MMLLALLSFLEGVKGVTVVKVVKDECLGVLYLRLRLIGLIWPILSTRRAGA